MLLVALLLLSSCGKADTPVPSGNEESKGDTILITNATEENDTEGTTPNDGAVTPEGSSDTTPGTPEEEALKCKTEKDVLSEALVVNTDELDKCTVERTRYAEKINELSSGGVSDSEKYEKFLTYYLENKDLREYPFPKCGLMGVFAPESWYGDFQKKLEEMAIPFGNRTVEVTDLSGGCYSAEGGTAFFLGADDGDRLKEFHLLRYSINEQVLEEAFLVGGKCVVCPDEIGKRFGPYLTIIGRDGSTNVEYEYYYDDNILRQK